MLTGRDLPVRFGILPATQDERALEFEKVRYVGDPVAAVAAVDEETAAAAIHAIEVRYEVLQAITSIEEALREPADERIHPTLYARRPFNVQRVIPYEFGDVAAGFAAADHVREDLFSYQGSTHLPLEQHSAVAATADGRLTVWSSTQVVYYVHRALARVLGLPMHAIRVVGTVNGGGFGGKSDPFAYELVVAKLAMLTGRLPLREAGSGGPRPGGGRRGRDRARKRAGRHDDGGRGQPEPGGRRHAQSPPLLPVGAELRARLPQPGIRHDGAPALRGRAGGHGLAAPGSGRAAPPAP